VDEDPYKAEDRAPYRVAAERGSLAGFRACMNK